MNVTVKTFAQLRELTQEASVSLTLPEGAHSMNTVVELLKARNDKWALAFDGSVLMARNQQLCDLQTQVQENDELAFFPPVTGG